MTPEQLTERDGRESKLWTDIGARVQMARKAVGFTQVELANLVPVSRGSLANIERGVQPTSLIRLIRIAEAIGVGLDFLLPMVRREPGGSCSKCATTRAALLHLAEVNQ